MRLISVTLICLLSCVNLAQSAENSDWVKKWTPSIKTIIQHSVTPADKTLAKQLSEARDLSVITKAKTFKEAINKITEYYSPALQVVVYSERLESDSMITLDQAIDMSKENFSKISGVDALDKMLACLQNPDTPSEKPAFVISHGRVTIGPLSLLIGPKTLLEEYTKKTLRSKINLSDWQKEMRLEDAFRQLEEADNYLPVLVMWDDLRKFSGLTKDTLISIGNKGILSLTKQDALVLLVMTADKKSPMPLSLRLQNGIVVVTPEILIPTIHNSRPCNSVDRKQTANKNLAKQLSQPVDLTGLNKKTCLSDAITFLRNGTHPPLPIVVMWNDLWENAFIEKDTPIALYCDGITSATTQEALDLILSSIGNTQYAVEDEVIVIGTHIWLTSTNGFTRNISLNLKLSGSSETQKKLEKKVDISFLKEETTLQKALTQIAKLTEPPLPIAVIWGDLSENAFIEKDTKIGLSLEDIPTVSLATTLDLLLCSISTGGFDDLNYFIKNDVIVIITGTAISDAMYFCGLEPQSEAKMPDSLKQNINISDLSEETTFEKAMQRIANSTHPPLSIKVLWEDLSESAFIERDTPIGLSFQNIPNVPIDFALHLILYSESTVGLAPLDYTYINDQIVIGKEDTLKKMTNETNSANQPKPDHEN